VTYFVWIKRVLSHPTVREEADRFIANWRAYVGKNETAGRQVDDVIKEEQQRDSLGAKSPALESTPKGAPSSRQRSETHMLSGESSKVRREQRSHSWHGGSGERSDFSAGAGTSVFQRSTIFREKVGTLLRLYHSS